MWIGSDWENEWKQSKKKYGFKKPMIENGEKKRLSEG